MSESQNQNQNPSQAGPEAQTQSGPVSIQRSAPSRIRKETVGEKRLRAHRQVNELSAYIVEASVHAKASQFADTAVALRKLAIAADDLAVSLS